MVLDLRKYVNSIWCNIRIRRIKTNKELEELINHLSIINYVKAKRLIWFGHINRMPETRIVRKIYKWKPSTSRPVGGPKFRWEDGVRDDLRKVELIKWVEQVQDRLKWKDVVEKPRLYHSCSAE